jgi:alpha-beta hydrolase superfamily lysophospholipase
MEAKPVLLKIAKRMLLNIIIIIAGAYILLGFILYFMQSKFLFHPRHEIFATPRSLGMDFEEIWLKTGDNVKLHAWFIPAKDAEYTILFCHGNGGSLAHRVETIELYNRMGFNFFIFDYRGYGLSSGKITEHGLFNDADAAWQYLIREKHIPPGKIIIIGRSLGGAVAARLAAENQPAKLICESTFLSIPEMGKDLYPYFPVQWLSRYKFATNLYVKQVKCPVMIIHSKDDEVVKYRHAEKLYNLAGEPKRFLELTGGHDECYFDNRDKYSSAVKSFIQDRTQAK